MANGEFNFLKIANQYIDQGFPGLALALASNLDRSGRALEGDIIRGEVALHGGDLETAHRHWIPHTEAPVLWPRLAALELRRGNPREALAYFERSGARSRDAVQQLDYAVALATLGRRADALAALEVPSRRPEGYFAILASLLRIHLLEQTGQAGEADAERGRFARELNELRRRLEIEGGEKEFDAVIRWVRERERVLPSPAVAELQRTLTLQITVPMAHYYRGVRHFLLGENAAAAAELRKYLATLPDMIPSRAREVLAMTASSPMER